MTTEIIPGINEKDWQEIEKKLQRIQSLAAPIHIDISDGKFAEATTFLDPRAFAHYTQDRLFEVHLMVDEPEQYIKPFAEAGFRRFIGQVEKMSDQASFVALGQIYGEVGLALDVMTPVSTLAVAFDDLDFVTVMTVKAGASGQTFQKEQLLKCEEIRSHSGLSIEVDGGINTDTISQAILAGVTRTVVTSALFKENPMVEYMKLQKAIEKTQNL